MIRALIFLFLILKASFAFSQGYNVFGIGIYDVKFDGSSSKNATDIRYERRFDNTIIDIGPEQDNFFYLKPFAGIELTSDSAYYLISGIYLEDNIGDLITGKENNWNLTPSFGVGYYDDGDGKIKKDFIEKAISTLNDRERTIIKLRKLKEKSITLDELGQMLKISKERVRQIETKALGKLKTAILEISQQNKEFFI